MTLTQVLLLARAGQRRERRQRADRIADVNLAVNGKSAAIGARLKELLE